MRNFEVGEIDVQVLHVKQKGFTASDGKQILGFDTTLIAGSGSEAQVTTVFLMYELKPGRHKLRATIVPKNEKEIKLRLTLPEKK